VSLCGDKRLTLVERRKTIIAAIKGFGGTYYKNLDRSCTHLISAKPTAESKSSEKVQWAIKELRDRDLSRRRGKKVEGHDIKICYEEWIWDCVAFCGRFQEDRYDARKPRPEGRVKAEDVLNGTVRFDDESEPAVAPATKAEGGEKDDGPAVLRKRKREDIDSLVGDLISTTVAKAEAGNDGPSSRALNSSGPSRPGPASTSNELRKASLLHATRTASFGPASFAFGPQKSSNLDPTPSMPDTAPQPPTGDVLKGREGVVQMFAGLRFSHLIDEAYEGMERALIAHGGVVVTEEARLEGEQVDLVIVRL
jgi:DNA replication regulator DPB11